MAEMSTFKAPGGLADWFSRSRGALLAVWLVYLLPRAAMLLIEVTPTSDADWYYQRAIGLAAGAGYLGPDGQPTAFWPPGWSFALGLEFLVTGPSPQAVAALNLLFSAVIAWLTLDLGRRLFGSKAAGRAGLLLLAIYPNNIAYIPLALTEIFYTALLLAGCRLLIARQSGAALIAAGLVFGLATLVKVQTLAVVPIVFAIALLREPGWRRQLPGAVLRMAMLAAIAALVVLPWTIRNHQQLGGFVPISANGGITLLTGNNDSADGRFNQYDPAVVALNRRSDLGELAYDAEAKRLALAWIAAHPGRFAALMPLKLAQLWGPDGEAQWAYELGYADYAAHAGLFRAIRIANQVYYFALLLLFALAAAAMIRQRRGAGLGWIDWWLLPYGIAAYPSAIAMVFSGQSRFHFPVMPFVCMACGWLLARWLVRGLARPEGGHRAA